VSDAAQSGGAQTGGQQTGDLRVDPELRAFVADELLPRVGITPDRFWSTLAGLQERFAPRAAELLARRDELQAQLDAWHREHGAPAEDDLDGYVQFLTEIGYLLPQEEPRISVTGVDREIAEVAGPQLVVPATVPRYALNAANARWGSLFDALYGTDALPLDHELARGYDERRGAQVIAEADRLLDAYFPLQGASHADVTAYRLDGSALAAQTADGAVGLADPDQLVGYRGDPGAPEAVLLRRNGLHAELSVDGASRVGRQHHAEVADVVLESAVTTIVDLEDSVATVDGPDKVGAYRSWLGLMTGELEASFPKGGETVTRTVNGDRIYTAPDGSELVLPGRSLLLVRNVGHHMRLDAVTTADGEPLLEECLDILVSTIAALHDLRGLGRFSNSRTGSLYVVKPKMHGPDEVGLSVDLFTAVEEALELPPTTIKIGIMDEERRTSTNLEACIARAADRVIFVNTGFLDRTGDEIHSDFEAGPVVRKDDEKSTTWLRAYEDRNVDVALRAGFAGHAQIGKGMWASPPACGRCSTPRGAQPKAGANTAWVPSPTAATLHALHYLETDVKAVQAELAARP
jgi:malate synthase